MPEEKPMDFQTMYSELHVNARKIESYQEKQDYKMSLFFCEETQNWLNLIKETLEEKKEEAGN
jgi:hypothetical protein